ncbi:MAG: hypothetical protein ACJ75J_04680 [Cytophagaceae bacterium]
MNELLTICGTSLAGVILARLLSVTTHEFGHGIFAWLFTKGPITLYIGSLGDPTRSLAFKVGRFHVYFKYNIMRWNTGLCIPGKGSVSLTKNMVITAAGPAFSLLLAIACAFLISTPGIHGIIKTIIVFVMGSAVIDFLFTASVREEPVKLYDGSLTYNDGRALKELWKQKNIYRTYFKIQRLKTSGNFETAEKLIDALLLKSPADSNALKIAASAYLDIRKYQKAEDCLHKIENENELSSSDLCTWGLIYSFQDKNSTAMEYYEQSLQLDPANIYTLNNIAYTFNLMEHYDKAIEISDKVMELDKNFPYAYNNRGLARIKKGDEGGLDDLKKGLSLDENNSYGYLNLGIYYFDKGNYKSALENFLRAKSIDIFTHQLDDYIVKARSGMEHQVH